MGWNRPELHPFMDQLRPGDTLFGGKTDRLSRSLKNLLSLLEKMQAAGVGIPRLTEGIDTTTPSQADAAPARPIVHLSTLPIKPPPMSPGG